MPSDDGVGDSQYTLSPYIAQSLHHRPRALDVGEHDGGRAVGSGLRAEVRALDLGGCDDCV